MGIQGLLPFFKKQIRKRSLQSAGPKRIAVDGFCWLHRAAYGCAMELCCGKKTNSYVRYCIRMIRLLRSARVEPWMVFDGRSLPMKQGTNDKRGEARKDAFNKGHAFLAAGNAEAARRCFTKAVQITPQMVHAVCLELQKEKVMFTVAPYEADAQLGFLCRTGLVEAVLTEDSDIIPFGAKEIWFKFDGQSEFESITLEDVFSRVGSSWTMERIIDMCVLSGCDYVPSLKGVGVKTAYKWLSILHTRSNVVQRIRRDGGMEIPEGYEELCDQAVRTFLHQRVFDPVAKRIVCLTPIPGLGEERMEEYAKETEFLGPLLPHTIAHGIACGVLNAKTLRPFAEEQEEEAIRPPQPVRPPSPCSSFVPLHAVLKLPPTAQHPSFIPGQSGLDASQVYRDCSPLTAPSPINTDPDRSSSEVSLTMEELTHRYALTQHSVVPAFRSPLKRTATIPPCASMPAPVVLRQPNSEYSPEDLEEEEEELIAVQEVKKASAPPPRHWQRRVVGQTCRKRARPDSPVRPPQKPVTVKESPPQAWETFRFRPRSRGEATPRKRPRVEKPEPSRLLPGELRNFVSPLCGETLRRLPVRALSEAPQHHALMSAPRQRQRRQQEPPPPAQEVWSFSFHEGARRPTPPQPQLQEDEELGGLFRPKLARFREMHLQQQ